MGAQVDAVNECSGVKTEGGRIRLFSLRFMVLDSPVSKLP